MTGRREELIEAAANLLDAGGPRAVTLREVGRAAGVSHNAPYRHFPDKARLLAAIAARELRRQVPGEEGLDVERRMAGYVRWALAFPERFRLVFGRWEIKDSELAAAADAARVGLVGAVTAAQDKGRLPVGDAERMASLLLALAHGAVTLALAGHLARDGKGRASPEDLVADLFACLRASGGATGGGG
ncbi:MAG TPA: TetR/AcrR family transcriptional regulator [Caulobacteraceae bacterium]|jgi:AcrR family transcriptional regulator|nr:TetR/AcrR family transcriptional regulator [Caulobacteraceae bacterium]